MKPKLFGIAAALLALFATKAATATAAVSSGCCPLCS